MCSRDARELAYLAQIDHLKSEVQEKKGKEAVLKSPKVRCSIIYSLLDK